MIATAASAGCPFATKQSNLRSSSVEHVPKNGAVANPLVLGRFKIPPVSRRNRRRYLQEEEEVEFGNYESSAYSNQRRGDGATIPEGGYDAVRADITALLTDSQDFWPGDFDEPHGPH